jgi:hypothetical protein
VTARALPVHADRAPSRVASSIDDGSVLASADAGRAASAALVALNATAVAAGATPMRAFIEDLAGMLPIRLTVHQRELLETALTRAVDAIIVQRAG